jgi:hypothetical protein
MSKNKFRLLITSSLILAVLAGVYDYFWIDPISEQVMDYAYEIEPEIEGSKLITIVVVGILAIVFAIISFIGLLLFKSWARPLYLAGFVLFMPLYPFMGVTVYSGASLIFYDLSMIASGAILALLNFFSPHIFLA